ncbi:pseudouridine synthase [Capnocytophaga canimorsus]|uniref:pseudouridine synthase n=1 Tax=Capnocytophaga canimorsus TaxID=28188 RepID=UPI000D6E2F9B|nr:pseudouridine synthase [Capnocytophaga canimorsus]AWL78371.1 pseudouridine synthase [Capnocytophaga canimorsus]AYW36993.1 rRNA pseudouridine synthase [Capnocytophaga canimorsus]MDT9499714.1 rRNA pseudouridine synthase [Capnocytophaga canimorsus]
MENQNRPYKGKSNFRNNNNSKRSNATSFERKSGGNKTFDKSRSDKKENNSNFTKKERFSQGNQAFQPKKRQGQEGNSKPFVSKGSKPFKPFKKENAPAFDAFAEKSEIRLNKYIADAGICSRRNADIYIASGNVQVNGEVITQLGFRVKPNDVVKFDSKVISCEKKEYILLNKPKGFITTTADEKGRKTVMDLVGRATSARILPVGRLDRPTTGLLLFTNDGDLAKKLTHPTHGVLKIYHAILDKKLDYKDFLKIEEGLELEDGFIQVEEISYVDGAPKNEIGIKIRSGRNRIIRRIFEHLGYQVDKLDRVVFAGLTKKDLPRGHWRRLTQQEIINLKNIK